MEVKKREAEVAMERPGVPEFTVLSDHFNEQSGSVSGQDLFSLEERLGSLFDILRHKDSAAPLSFALYGASGTGKTTALRWLAEQLTSWNEVPLEERGGHPEILLVRFTATEIQEGESVIYALASGIVLECLNGLPEEEMRQECLRDAACMCGGILGNGLISRLRMLGIEWGLESEAVEEACAEGSALSGSETSFAACMAFCEKWVGIRQEAGRPVRMVTMTDDLDHCSAERTMEVLNAVASAVQSPAMIYVVGLDQAVLREQVAIHFREHGYGEMQIRQFLGRVFQGECHIEPTYTQLRKFYDVQYAALDNNMNNLLSNVLPKPFTGYIEEAVMYLSGANPQKIKLLLNSAMMKAYASGRKDGGIAMTSRLAQRIQAYLLQTWLGRTEAGTDGIHRKDILDWLAALSHEAVKSGSNYEKTLKMIKEMEDPEEAYRHSRNRGFENLSKLKSPADMDVSVIKEWVWNLLKIPFDAEMSCLMDAHKVPVKESGEVKREEAVVAEADYSSKSEMLSMASDLLKHALASTLEKETEDLTDEDVITVEHLDLSGKEIVEDDAEVLRGMHLLKRLNLTCCQISDLSPLSSLDNLQQLDLSYTPVDDLSPLSNLQQLETLILYGAGVKSLEGLRGLKGLTRLNLSHTKVADGDLKVLETLPALNHLFLRGTAVSAKMASELAQHSNYALRVEL